jgi:radical SAM/Cys-rich protein
MNRHVLNGCLEFLAKHSSCKNLDITGGAPELHPDFEYLVIEARKMGKHIVIRHNLTVTVDGDPANGLKMNNLPDLFATNQVEILASLPHFTKSHTDSIRGSGVFKKSIESLRGLNALGYGIPGTGLVLNIVHNLDGPILPEQLSKIEDRFRNELSDRYELVFNSILGVTNMPINRFRQQLDRSGKFENYMDSLVAAFNPAAVKNMVCRSRISVGHDGQLFDCDFNQMLDMRVMTDRPLAIFSADFNSILHRRIQFGPHCYGCTAGGGSS